MKRIYASLIREYAEIAGRKIALDASVGLQKITSTLSGDDSGLCNTWEEICVQVQGEESFFWDAYQLVMRDAVLGELMNLGKCDLASLWLQTDAGIDWRSDAESDPDIATSQKENGQGIPYNIDDIAIYIVDTYLRPLAEDWSNARTRAFLNQCDYEDHEDHEDEDEEVEVEVEDLEDTDVDSDEEDAPAPPFQICPVDEAEKSLAAMIDCAVVNRRSAEYAYGVEQCDFCKSPVAALGLFVDGDVRGGGGWANMCAKCFDLKGVGLGWGVGQLYAHQADGAWRLAYGFRSSNENDVNPNLAVGQQSASLDSSEAMKQLSADFGEDFTSLLCSVIDSRVANALRLAGK